MVFSNIQENWSLLESLYFSLVTLCKICIQVFLTIKLFSVLVTIGFGDFCPSTSDDHYGGWILFIFGGLILSTLTVDLVGSSYIESIERRPLGNGFRIFYSRDTFTWSPARLDNFFINAGQRGTGFGATFAASLCWSLHPGWPEADTVNHSTGFNQQANRVLDTSINRSKSTIISIVKWRRKMPRKHPLPYLRRMFLTEFPHDSSQLLLQRYIRFLRIIRHFS